MPTYNHTWFNPRYFSILDRYRNKPNIKFLEIGSFEGQSTNYFVETFLTGEESTITCIDPWIKYSEATIAKIENLDDAINEDTYTTFLKNIENNSSKIIIKKGFSYDIIPTLTDMYDFVFVDGDHSEKAVWLDAILSFEKLNVGGLIIFDDYKWHTGDKSPKNAIDRFMKEYAPYIKVIHIHYQVIIEKVANKEV